MLLDLEMVHYILILDTHTIIKFRLRCLSAVLNTVTSVFALFPKRRDLCHISNTSKGMKNSGKPVCLRLVIYFVHACCQSC